jgi:putative ABC transport system substrate-binding protein
MKKSAILVFLISMFCIVYACQMTATDEDARQIRKPYRVAVLLAADMYLPLSAEGLKEGMSELGYREGEDIEYTIYNAKGDVNKLKVMAKEIVQSRPDVICPSIISAIDAVKETGTDLPVVFLESMYPVEFGLVKSLNKPGTNYTGTSNMTGPMSGKRLELLKEMFPHIKKAALICNPDNQVSWLSLEESKRSAKTLELDIEAHLVYKHEEVDRAIAEVEAGTAEALMLNPDFMVFSRIDEIVTMALRKKIPTIGIDPTQVQRGILVSYGGGLKDIARQAARHVDKVLKGVPPAEIPIEAPRRYKLYINMKTAEEINASLPEEILLRAEGYYR